MTLSFCSGPLWTIFNPQVKVILQIANQIMSLLCWKLCNDLPLQSSIKAITVILSKAVRKPNLTLEQETLSSKSPLYINILEKMAQNKGSQYVWSQVVWKSERPMESYFLVTMHFIFPVCCLSPPLHFELHEIRGVSPTARRVSNNRYFTMCILIKWMNGSFSPEVTKEAGWQNLSSVMWI